MDPTKCNLKVNSSRVQYTDEAIESLYDYATSSVTEDAESGTYFVSLLLIFFIQKPASQPSLNFPEWDSNVECIDYFVSLQEWAESV